MNDERPRQPRWNAPAEPEFDPGLFTDPGVSEEAAMTFSEVDGKTAREIERRWAQLTPEQKDEVRRRLLREGLIDSPDGHA